MAQQLRERLDRIAAKCGVLVENYERLLAEKAAVEQRLAQANEQLERQAVELERLQRDNHYLRTAATLAPDADAAARSRQLLSKMVRDIDKCIAQLNS
ncbi:MAG: hypothetical protein IJU62_08845 [Muribaculaceae bacterium]|nr:hypothetical protein [Muribaculaceae bacterium]